MSSDDILLPLPVEKWPILAASLKKDWPDNGVYYSFVQTAIKWRLKEPEVAPTIFCPGGDLYSGIFVAISCFADYNVLMFAHKGLEELLYKVVTETKIINWTGCVRFPTVKYHLSSTVFSIIETLKQTKNMEFDWNVPGNFYFKSKEECAAVEIRVPEGCYLRKIDTSHVPLIHSLWPHRNEEHPELSTKFIMTFVRMNGSLGLFSKENNELLSWVLQSELGVFSMVQTIEKCKRRGYAKVVVNAFAKLLAENGEDSILFVVQGNLVAETMFRSLNWKRIYSFDWIQIKSL